MMRWKLPPWPRGRRRAAPWVLLGALSALVLTLAWSGGRVAVTGAQDPPSGEPAGFIDQARGTYLVLQLDASQPDAGRFTFAVPGVGVFVGDAPATVDPPAATGVAVRYAGAGTLDSAAVQDPVFTLWTALSGQAVPVTFQLVAQIGPDRTIATAQLVYASQVYLLTTQPAPQTADAVAANIADSFARQDWARLYGYGYRRLQATMTQDAFIAWQTKDVQAQGSVTGARVATAPVYSAHEAGYTTAVAQLVLTLTGNGTATTRALDAVLVLDGGTWKFQTFQPVP